MQTRIMTLLSLWVALAITVAPSPLAADKRPDPGRRIESMGNVLPHRQRPEVINRMLLDRLDNLLPGLMRETGIDLWLVINREYVEDPVYLTLVPEPVFAARRTTDHRGRLGKRLRAGRTQ